MTIFLLWFDIEVEAVERANPNEAVRWILPIVTEYSGNAPFSLSEFSNMIIKIKKLLTLNASKD